MIRKNIEEREYSVRRDKCSDRQKKFLKVAFFRDFKVIEVFLNETTYFHYNDLMVHKKINSTVCNMLTLRKFFCLSSHLHFIDISPYHKK